MNNKIAILKTLALFAVVATFVVGGAMYVGTEKQDAQERVRFSLTNHDNQRVSTLDFQGTYLVVLFGFTNCDAICPAGMSKLTRLLDRFDAEGYAARITPIFISVDPHRDDPKTIANYLESFHPRFVGLTGSNDELTSATIQFKTYFQATNRSPKEGEQLTHSTAMYVLDPYGRIVGLLPQQQSFEDSVSLLKTFLKS